MDKKIKIATVFSGIGAAEQALKQMGIPHEIVFACDNGERYFEQTAEEIAAKIDRNLGGGYMAGKGTLIAKTALEYGVDPFIAAAIIASNLGL